MFVLTEEAEAESANAYLFTTREDAQRKLASLREEYLDGETFEANDFDGVEDTADEFFDPEGDYWLHIYEQEVS